MTGNGNHTTEQKMVMTGGWFIIVLPTLPILSQKELEMVYNPISAHIWDVNCHYGKSSRRHGFFYHQIEETNGVLMETNGDPIFYH